MSKMNYYRYVPDPDEYDSLVLSDEIETALDDATPLSSKWKTPFLDATMVGKRGDFPSLGLSAPVFSQRAWKKLKLLISTEVEALPIQSPIGSYYAIHVLGPVDCLRLSESVVARTSSGRIIAIEHYSFNVEILLDKHLFKIPETAEKEVLVSDVFRTHVKRAKLCGLLFEKLTVTEK